MKNLSDFINTILYGAEQEKASLRQTFFKMAATSEALKAKGLIGECFVVSYGVISHHKGKDSDHDYTADEWKEICKKINTPIDVVSYKDGFNIYVDVIKNGKPTLIGVSVKQTGKNSFVNAVRTVMAKKITRLQSCPLETNF